MYKLSKRVIAQFIRSECQRRLRLNLYADDKARLADGAPGRQVIRPGLQLLAANGRAFEAAKFKELKESFPHLVEHGVPLSATQTKEGAYKPLELTERFASLFRPGKFVLEGTYEVGEAFRTANKLTRPASFFSDVRPDIMHVREPDGKARRTILPDGQVHTIAAEDGRLGIRIIDVKASAEPSPGHFAELAYYGMVLAGWLVDHGHDDRFVVLADAAIWSGKHEASNLFLKERKFRQEHGHSAPDETLFRELEEDLESMVPEVVIARVVRFLRHDVEAALAPSNWRDLPWHVNTSCSGCDYLGYSWKTRSDDEDGLNRGDGEGDEGSGPFGARDAVDPVSLYCWPEAAEVKHLSRIHGISRGATGKLAEDNIRDLMQLAGTKPAHPVFDSHQTLRTYRTVFTERAQTLVTRGDAKLADRSGTSAIMPAYADISICMSADFDVGSGLTFVLGSSFDVGMPTGWDPVKKIFTSRRDDTIVGNKGMRVMLIDEKSVEREREAFSEFLRFLATDIRTAADAIVKAKTGFNGGNDDANKATIQFYVWDRLTYDHLCRLVGRHIDQIRTIPLGSETIEPLLWLIPSDRMLGEADFAKANSPLTILSEAIGSLVAADLPHHYSLLGLAHKYQTPPPAGGTPFEFRVNKFYFDPLSDQMPSERGHEIWNRSSPSPARIDRERHRDLVKSTVQTKLRAIASIRRRLAKDLRGDLRAKAPDVEKVLRRPERLPRAADDSQIILQHARLMDAAEALENSLLMAMPPYQREAKYDSIRLVSRAEGPAAAATLQDFGLPPSLIRNRDVMVFSVSPRSTESRIKEEEFNVSLLPESALPISHRTLRSFEAQCPRLLQLYDKRILHSGTTLREACKVDILKFDRAGKRIVVKASHPTFRALEQSGVIDLALSVERASFAIIDPMHRDFFISKFKKALPMIGMPKVSIDRPLFIDKRIARGKSSVRHKASPDTPATRFIWDAESLACEPSSFSADEIESAIGAYGALSSLNDRQKEAVRNAASKRLSVVWGPPGTGKSMTAANLLLGFIGVAIEAGRKVRIAITGPNWTAIDNVAKRMPAMIGFANLLGPGDFSDVMVRRLSSVTGNASIPSELEKLVVVTNDDNNHETLVDVLENGSGCAIVAGTADQLWKLGKGKPLFDILLVDEASQMDVAHAMTAFTCLADQRSSQVIIVGDDLQMPPVHPIDPPEGAEHLVGSIYDFYRRYRKDSGGPADGIPRTMLSVNYRSNGPIVDFVREAGYRSDLVSSAPAARLSLAAPVALGVPAAWPTAIPWSSEFDRILDPDRPLVAVVHNDIYASQQNMVEADLVAGLALSLRGRLLDENGVRLPDAKLFAESLGIVTPHRAQQSAIVGKLVSCMPPSVTPESIYKSVDTVERFQGQERDVIIASFGLGDADQIAGEEEFLFSLNRFNVIASRAKTKLVIILSRRLVDHLPSDRKALADSRLLKHYVDGYLRSSEPISIMGYPEACELRYR